MKNKLQILTLPLVQHAKQLGTAIGIFVPWL